MENEKIPSEYQDVDLDPLRLLKQLDVLREHLIRSSPMYSRAVSPAYDHPRYHPINVRGSPFVDTISVRPSFLSGHNFDVSKFCQSVANLSLDPDRLPTRLRSKELNDWDKHSRPTISSAAPFVLCCNCSELLRLTDKMLALSTKSFKLRCGSCSELLLLTYEGKRLVASSSSQFVDSSIAESHNRSDSEVNNPLHPGGQDVEKLNSDSDYHDSNNNIHFAKQNLASGTTSRRKMINKESSPALGNSVMKHEIPKTDDRPIEFESVNHGKITKCSAEPLSNGIVFSEAARPQADDNFKMNYRKDEIDTEIDFVSGDYPRHSAFQEPLNDIDQGGDEDHYELLFAGATTNERHKEFPLFSHPRKNSSSKVSVNGHLVSDNLIKEAEKKAGPILPGEYWYDNRCGFWGVMGQPCLGIIPPLIEELDYPMTKNCANGDTGIFINGRELHEKDLDLLVSRGLPPSTGQSYILEISGKVLDAVSGVELCTIRKLAPTVVKIKQGFGMQVPRL